MQTDQAIYQYLATGPEAFRVLTGGMILSGPYQFSAKVFKGIERRIDALFEPKDHDGPVYVVEFQAQWNPAAWYNLLTKIGLYGERHPMQEVRGILIFPSRANEAQKTRWISHAYSGQLTTVYLEDFLPELLTQEADNPFVVVFAPLLLTSDRELEQQAPSLWRTIHTAQVSDAIRTNLEQILVFWFLERFKALNAQEILTMFQTLTPLEETCGYKSIFVKGEAKGKAEGIAEGIAEGEAKGEIKGKAKGEAVLLKRQIIRRFGKLPKWAEKRIDKAESAQLKTWAEAIFDAQDVKQLLGK